MAGVREQKKQQTRKAIVDAAIKLFTDKGFDQTSMDELAGAAGVGKGTIYGYFKAKEEIFLAYCEAEIKFSFAALDRKLDEEAPLVEQLVAQMMGQIAFVTENREFGRLFIREMLFPSEDQRLASHEIEKFYLDKLDEVLRRAQENGELPEETDVLLLIAHLHGLYVTVLSSFYRGDLNSLDSAEVFARSLVLQVLHGPAALAVADAEVRRQWQDLKRQALEQRNLEMRG